MAIVLAAIEVTIVSTAMPTIVRDLGNIHLMSWVFAIYLLATAITTPIYGKLADLFGRKKVFTIGIVIFLIGSSLCSLAHSMAHLIFFRAIQGIGAGALFPVSLTIIGDIFNIEERAKIQGLISAIWFISGILGPLVGGFIVDLLSWHWIFLINIPFGLLSISLIKLFFHEQFTKKKRYIDYPGAITFTIGMTSLLYAIILGGQNKAWISPITLSLLINAVGFLSLFYFIELKSPEPILPLNLFKLPMVMVPNLATFFLCTVLIGLNVYLPIWVQGVLSYKATGSGIALIPMSVGWTLGAFYCGKLLMKFSVRNTTSLGAGAILAGCSLLVAMGFSIFELIFGMFIIGLGFGLALTSSGIVIQSSVEWNLRGSATALFTFTQALGQTVGVAMLGVLFYHTVSTGSATLNKEVLTFGLHNIFIALSVISVLGLFINLWIPKQKLSGSKLL
ncbi:major facilitator superfamily MFS_1 [Desulfofarcimen acetoxidans DSM 771]|uniref:Major facilitator superfamily MFS_1 n=2 Tax=Desulfofarcimen acetoxidans TaxID=58138 RepID=C8VXL2_DESAS|nr:MDR family MFS transporter [Desulfofarcimen acetoxidans]ACV62668.1 major facilitator superfamily MFS_1 [Desulfofarcimen acetoxidans DSM 771]